MNKPSFLNPYSTEIKVGDKTIKLEVGRYSEQASAAVLATCGETVVHATIASGGETSLDYFPLSVEFAEKLYAGGRIKGSRWVKRDGRPTDEAILKGRLIDRSIRPLFPKGLKREVQVVATVLSVDGENDADMIAMLAITAGLSISDIPWNGPITGVRAAKLADGSVIFNPNYVEREGAVLDLVLSGNKDGIVMVEAGAKEVSEQDLIEIFGKTQEVLASVCDGITKMVSEIGKEKFAFTTPEDPTELIAYLGKRFEAEVKQFTLNKATLQPTGVDQVVKQLLEEVAEQGESAPAELQGTTAWQLREIFDLLIKKEARRQTLHDRVRPDGRKLDEIRELITVVDLLPRPHGTAMFKRGSTQVLSVTTLGAPSLGQIIEDMEGEETKHFLHHYNMPPYAAGEAGRIGPPKRREIGHGALAERALEPMLPSQIEFPYTIHVVSEVMSSNGSTSMASTCATSMSLMAAGVPLKKPVAGIAMGLMTEGEKYSILTDIQGMEDYTGDMDFKVAGTRDGITAMQMDIKISGISMQQLEEALLQAKTARLQILDKMGEAIDAPRAELSKFAPKIVQLEIPQEKIGGLIGPGGKIIKNIIAVTGAQVDVDEDEERKLGIVNISSSDQEAIDKAYNWISGMMREVTAGEEFDGIVTRVESFGAFVEFLPGREGLVHVSRMSNEFIEDPSTIVKVGDAIRVVLDEVDQQGRNNLRVVGVEARPNNGGGDRPRGGSFRDRNDSRGGNRGGGDRNRFSRPPRR